MANNNRLGERLVREKLISLSQLRHAQDEQQKSGNNLGFTLAKLGYVSDEEITSFLSQQYRVPTVNLEEYEIDAVVDGFAESARSAAASDLDGVEIDAGSHSLLRQFHSGVTNLRTDAYGSDRLLVTREGLAAVPGGLRSARI